MSFTYANYTEETDPRQRAIKLRQHITEVSQKLTREVQADGNSVASQSLTEYRRDLRDELKELEATIGTVASSVTTRVTQLRINRP